MHIVQNDTVGNFLDHRVQVVIGDITKQDVDAIVNAADPSLLGGGGVDGAIHQAGGSKILEACQEIRQSHYPGGLPTGQAVITTAGALPARFVIHTVGPVYGQHDGREAQLLAGCYKNSLLLASSRGLTSIAFPAISTGVFGYPRPEAAEVSSQAITEHLAEDNMIKEVRLVFYQHRDAEVFLDNHKFK